MERSEVKEGKIELRAACDGLFRVNSEALIAVNSIDDIMIATRHGNTAVKRGDKLAGTRVIPLIIEEEKLAAAGIRDRFENTDLTKCLKDITKYLKEAGI